MQNETITFKHTEKASDPGQKTVCASNVDPGDGDENNIPNNNQKIFEEHRKEGKVISLSALKEKGLGKIDFESLGLSHLDEDSKHLVKGLKLNIHPNKDGRLIGKLTLKNQQNYRDKNGRRLRTNKIPEKLYPLKLAGVYIYEQEIGDIPEVFNKMGEDGYSPGRQLIPSKNTDPDAHDYPVLQHFLDMANANIYRANGKRYLVLYNVANNDFFFNQRLPLIKRFMGDKFDEIMFHAGEYNAIPHIEGVKGRKVLPPEASKSLAEAADDFDLTLLEQPTLNELALYQVNVSFAAAEKYNFDSCNIDHFTNIFAFQRNADIYYDYDIEER